MYPNISLKTVLLVETFLCDLKYVKTSCSKTNCFCNNWQKNPNNKETTMLGVYCLSHKPQRLHSIFLTGTLPYVAFTCRTNDLVIYMV